MYLPIEDGKKIAMPRYYKDKIYNETERKRLAHLGQIAATKAQGKLEDYYFKLYGAEWPRFKAEADLHAFAKFKLDAEKYRDKI